MQITTFPIEIIIHDDASIDNTSDIIREYEIKYPEIIKPIYQTENQWSKGIKPSPTYVWPRARGKYIALCEGDDYWTDPHKLQKQVDFMENHQEYSLCSHRYSIYNSSNGLIANDNLDNLFNENSDGIELNLDNFFKNWITKTLTIVFRKSLFDYSIVSKYKLFRDFHLFFYLLQKGKGYCFNFNGGVYTAHEGGIYSTKTLLEKLKTSFLIIKEIYNIDSLEIIRKHLVFIHATYIDALIQNLDRPVNSGEIIKNIYLLKKETSNYIIIIKRIIKLTGRYIQLLMQSFKTAPRI